MMFVPLDCLPGDGDALSGILCARAGAGQAPEKLELAWQGTFKAPGLGLCWERSQGHPLQLASRGSLNPQQMLPEPPCLISPASLEKSYSLLLLSHKDQSLPSKIRCLSKPAHK